MAGRPWFSDVGLGVRPNSVGAAGSADLPSSMGTFCGSAQRISPDTGLLVPMNSLFLEHWMYLPTLGLLMGIGQTIYAWDWSKPTLCKIPAGRLRGIVLIVVSGRRSARTFDQNAVWHDPGDFLTRIFSKYGEISARAHNNLALAYMDQHNSEKAIEEFQNAIAISDSYAETHFNMSLALLNLPNQKEHIPEAISHLNRSLEIDPNFYRSYDALAKIYAFTNEPEKAALNRQKADALLAARP